MEKYEPHTQGTGALDAESFTHLLSLMFDHEPMTDEDVRYWTFTPPSSSLHPATFTISEGDIPLYVSRRMMHELHKRQARAERLHRRKLIARRQKRAAFRRKMRGLA